MKYIEQIKSVLLTFLVLLSIALTLMIWNYKPVYPTIVDNSVKDVTIGEKKELKDVLKPYRVLYHEDNHFKGSGSSAVIDETMALMSKWSVSNFMLMDNNLSSEEINDFSNRDEHLTFMFSTLIPLSQYNNVLSFDEVNLPQAAFNRIVLDWSDLADNSRINMYFLNTQTQISYRANVVVTQRASFKKAIADITKNYNKYLEIERPNELSLYISEGKSEAIQYEYYIDEISPDIFKTMLFEDTSIVERSVESAQIEKYTDSMALMTLDKQHKAIHYVYPAAEGFSELSPGKLLRDSFDFINEHGGFTEDYRYSTMNLTRHIMEYQLYVQGYPVFSDNTSTQIITTWGDDRIFSYRRPYYSLDIGDQSIKELPDADQVLAYIEKSNDIDINSINDIFIGYYLTQNADLKLINLEPSWFVIEDSKWTRIVLEDVGGTNNGLE